MRRIISLLCICGLACATPGTVAAARAPTLTWLLALRFHAGERIAQRTDEVDRVDWKLPEHRLERFRAAGVIINEEQRVTTSISATVVSVIHSIAVLQGEGSIVSVDVPRHQTQLSRSTFSAALAPNGVPVPAIKLQIEDAPMAGLPQAPVALGGRWATHFTVTTTLGSGVADFEHTAVSIDNGLLEISIEGRGTITGAEYHLPKLLPGTISLAGTAWYDPASRIIVRESYAIHNRLIKPMEGEDSGFDEQLSVDSSTRVVSP